MRRTADRHTQMPVLKWERMSVSVRVVMTLALAAVLAAGAVGCGDVNGGQEPFAGTVKYQDPGGQFELHLLIPPWIPIPPIGGTTIFVVPPDTLSITAVTSEADATYSLDVSAVGGDAAGAMQAAATAGGWHVQAGTQRTIKTASGATGVEASWQESALAFHREAFIGGATASSFHLHFSSKKPIAGDDMITQMIVGFSPRVSVTAVGDTH
jgi:hypothetical protein